MTTTSPYTQIFFSVLVKRTHQDGEVVDMGLNVVSVIRRNICKIFELRNFKTHHGFNKRSHPMYTALHRLPR